MKWQVARPDATHASGSSRVIIGGLRVLGTWLPSGCTHRSKAQAMSLVWSLSVPDDSLAKIRRRANVVALQFDPEVGSQQKRSRRPLLQEA